MQKYAVSTLVIIYLMITACGNQATGTPISVSSLGDHFPQLINTPNAHYDLSVMGELVVENGCLRVSEVNNGSGRDSFLLIWDGRFSTQTKQSVVKVIDSITGEVLASAGDFVEIGYGGDLAASTQDPIPDECKEPYMVVGETIKKMDRPSLGAYFPQLTSPQSASETTTITGELVLENGCLRINNANGNSVLLIWNLRFSSRTEQGGERVINSDTGKILVSMGDFVVAGGGFIDNPESWGLIKSLPEDCPGPYYLVGESIKKIDKP